MHLVLVGTSHRRAPVELRELVAFGSARAGRIARSLAGEGEAVALSTCNRTELYLAAEDAAAARARAVAELTRLAGLPAGELEASLYFMADDAAALHLCRVAAGLDSMVRGEGQILGQVRAAYEASQAAGATGPTLHRLFRHALRAGKRVRTETAIAENPASIASAAVELVERVFGELAGTRLLVLGAGKMGEQTALGLVARGATDVVVANRSLERAAAVAERFGARATGLDALGGELAAADVVVASTSSEGFVVTREQVERAVRGRAGRPLFFVDIAVPRDVDPEVDRLDGCYLYDVDDLERVVAHGDDGRAAETARAEAVVLEEAEAFRAWRLSRDVVPAIASLRALAETIRREELARAEARLGDLSPTERRAIDALTTRIVDKLLHLPTVRLKEAAAAANGTADGVLYADAVRHLFGLREEER
ncbi:MAG TPA: glutamyl-tRNA reductase [Gaiellaceae bacterium]|nr:glutamyl-tRNA reductase [Gaiellaceae bacterium]